MNRHFSPVLGAIYSAVNHLRVGSIAIRCFETVNNKAVVRRRLSEAGVAGSDGATVGSGGDYFDFGSFNRSFIDI